MTARTSRYLSSTEKTEGRATQRSLHEEPDTNPHARFRDAGHARKLVYLAIRNHESNWKRPMAGWYECLAAFHAHYGDRLNQHT